MVRIEWARESPNLDAGAMALAGFAQEQQHSVSLELKLWNEGLVFLPCNGTTRVPHRSTAQASA